MVASNGPFSSVTFLLTSNILFVFIYLFRAAPTAYGNSQARGWNRAVPTLFISLKKKFGFLGLNLQDMEAPRLRVKSELYMLAYATATGMPDLSRVLDLHHSSQRDPYSLSEARDWTHVLMNPSRVCYCWATMGTPHLLLLFVFICHVSFYWQFIFHHLL